MSDMAPSPVKGASQQASKNQIILVAVLGVVLLLVLVFVVLKPFDSGDDASSSTPAVTATNEPSGSSDDSGSSANSPAREDSEPVATGAAPARNRNPFDPPR